MTQHNIFLVPSFQINFISVHKLLSQFDCAAYFIKTDCILQGTSLKRQLAIGRTANGLYFVNIDLNQFNPTILHSISILYSFSNFVSSPCLDSVHIISYFASIDVNKTDLYQHQRLGHISFNEMKFIPFFQDKISFKQQFIYDVFP